MNDHQYLEIARELEELAATIRYGVEHTPDASAHIAAADPTGGRREIIAAAARERAQWTRITVKHAPR